jgi:hypothetical protein
MFYAHSFELLDHHDLLVVVMVVSLLVAYFKDPLHLMHISNDSAS